MPNERSPDAPEIGASGTADRRASDLVASLYEELRTIAHGLLRNEREGHTLETSALVHEAFLRLARDQADDWRDRAYFLGAAAQTMRRVLVDHARARATGKRDGGTPATLVSLPDGRAGEETTLDVLAVDDALTRLARVDERQARIVELRVFGGYGIDEVAAIVGVSAITVKRDWRFAKAWLACELNPTD